jgi:hypothetical protein
VKHIIQTCLPTVHWWDSIKSPEERAAMISRVKAIMNPFKHVMSCISDAGAVSFYAQFSLDLMGQTTDWPSEFRRALAESSYEVLFMYLHTGGKKARVLFSLRSTDPAVAINTRNIALAISKVFHRKLQIPANKFIPVLYLTDTTVWAIAAAHISFWRHPTARFYCMFDPTRMDYMKLPGVTLIDMRLLLDWLMVPPFARMIRQSLLLSADSPQAKSERARECMDKFKQWGVPIDTTIRDHMVWIPKATGLPLAKMLVAASCLAQVKNAEALGHLLAALAETMRGSFPSAEYHHLERIDPTTRSMTTHIFLRFASPVNLCGVHGLYSAVQRVFDETMCATLLTVVPVDDFGGQEGGNPLAFGVLTAHFPRPSAERNAFWDPRAGREDDDDRPPVQSHLEFWVEKMQEWFRADPRLVVARFDELYLKPAQWLDVDLNEHTLSLRDLHRQPPPTEDRYERAVHMNCVLGRVASLTNPMGICADKMERGSRDIICAIRDGEFHRLDLCAQELRDAAGCCRGILPTLETMLSKPKPILLSPQSPRTPTPPVAVGQKRDASGERKKQVTASTPMQLVADDNPLKRVYYRLFEAHALLGDLMQGVGPRHDGDPYWMRLDWDRMHDDVEQMIAKLDVAQSIAHELYHTHKESFSC